MKSEVEDNLRKIYFNYREEHIRGFLDTIYFISTRLKNEHINAYKDLTSNLSIIDYLIETSESIDAVNLYAEEVLNLPSKSQDKKMSINMFLKNVEITKTFLLSLYKKLYGQDSFKQFEIFRLQ